MPETSPSVLVIRLDGIGDALALAPLLAAFASDGIPVDVVLRSANAGAFAPGAVRTVDVAPWRLRSRDRESIAAIDAMGATLAERNYTHVLVATEDPSGYRLARATGAPQRIGFDNGWGKPMKTWWIRRLLTRTIYRSAGLDPRNKHECEVLFELGRGLVSETEPTRDPARLRSSILAEPPALAATIAFQVTDKWERLGIPLETVAAAFRFARERTMTLPIAADSEREYVASFERKTGENVTRFARIEDWKLAIASHRALVAPDSGGVHVAGTVGTPVVAVFPDDGNFDRQVARWHPWAAPYRVLRAVDGWPQRVGDAVTEVVATVSGTR